MSSVTLLTKSIKSQVLKGWR